MWKGCVLLAGCLFQFCFFWIWLKNGQKMSTLSCLRDSFHLRPYDLPDFLRGWVAVSKSPEDFMKFLHWTWLWKLSAVLELKRLTAYFLSSAAEGATLANGSSDDACSRRVPPHALTSAPILPFPLQHLMSISLVEKLVSEVPLGVKEKWRLTGLTSKMQGTEA